MLHQELLLECRRIKQFSSINIITAYCKVAWALYYLVLAVVNLAFILLIIDAIKKFRLPNSEKNFDQTQKAQ